MFTKLTHVTLFVHDQDAALAFYQNLGWEVHTDADFGDMRWLTLALPSQPDFELVIMKAESEAEKALVGKQGGDKPFITLESDDCAKDYERLSAAGVTFLDTPTEQPWGTCVTLQDLCGNVIYICQPSLDGCCSSEESCC